MEKHWIKARSSHRKANTNSYMIKSNAKTAEMVVHFKLCTSNMLPSLGLVPIPVIRSLWQIYYTPGISNILRGSSAIQTSPSQLQAMASKGLHPDTLLPHIAWFQQLSETVRKISWLIYSFTLCDSKSASAEDGPSFAWIILIVLFWLLFRSGKVFRPFTLTSWNHSQTWW